MKKILITGAGGFIGSYFTNHLAHNVDACDRQALDLTNATQLRQQLQTEKYDAVIHCASAGRNATRSTDPTIELNNLIGFSNLLANRELFGDLINLATGAEFDIGTDICEVSEEEIWSRNPKHSYGRSKNIIARLAQTIPNFYNLRIFGCFDSSESDNRPLKLFAKKCQLNEPFVIPEDRLFDMVSVQDLLTVVNAVLAKKIHDKDLNIVYNKKYHLSKIIKMYAQLHNLDSELIQVSGNDTNSYTGNGTKLNQYQLPLLGLEQSLKIYNT
jgi:nucleoside-diphosphate-sugar epimerase